MKELPRREMLPALIQKLKKESALDMSRIREYTLWESFQNGSAHFVAISRIYWAIGFICGKFAIMGALRS